MNRLRAVLFLLFAFALLPLAAHAAAAPESPKAPDVFAITNVRLFDGTSFLPKSIVVVRGGKIEAVGPTAAIPEGATIVDGGGGVLLPGLIDCHTHTCGVAIPTLSKPEEASAWVAARVAEGSDYIKIVDEDGTSVGRKIPTLDPPTLAAVVQAAHQQGKMAVVHISTQAAARRDIEAGADGLVHIFADE